MKNKTNVVLLLCLIFAQGSFAASGDKEGGINKPLPPLERTQLETKLVQALQAATKRFDNCHLELSSSSSEAKILADYGIQPNCLSTLEKNIRNEQNKEVTTSYKERLKVLTETLMRYQKKINNCDLEIAPRLTQADRKELKAAGVKEELTCSGKMFIFTNTRRNATPPPSKPDTTADSDSTTVEDAKY